MKDRPGHDFRYAIDDAKLRALGWAPRTTFETALELTVDWYRSHPEWWQKIKGGEFANYYKSMYEGGGRPDERGSMASRTMRQDATRARRTR